MINISRNAWYIRYIMVFSNTIPSNLCQLIRFFLGATLAWLLIGTIGSAVLFLMIYSVGYLFGLVHDGFIMAVSLCFNGWLLAMALRGLSENNIISKDWFYYDITPDWEYKNPPLFSLFWKWMVSVHDGVCLSIKVK